MYLLLKIANGLLFVAIAILAITAIGRVSADFPSWLQYLFGVVILLALLWLKDRIYAKYIHRLAPEADSKSS